ncbi:tRNA threonylcarbamoyladenosine biosynthesis protein TsaB [Tsuneonella dongtanensis]|uniref:tRNA threonylcarbamoyladenosine biosynthesis protein TsaB n=1 Tax=Tsuneonella dongtanensis TaxID=692370 RepID=A0A1B2ADX9_9SPHN|nr:tRNA (adenosine(37)-N6)-threonylcarbamoyltransferase complex dimerization subunit type 1 TsaB [Tsuneonella dongtanensis]ANY20359.1 tRNA threonylcarbamoyladenosine biosynthesis protein TsaB [Tsuneonella dongtanensis]
MRTLAIECATEACSIALSDGDHLVAADHRVLGRGHAEHLVPMIASLPGRGRAERIMVSLGPGSFTGVRIGMAVANALAIAWGAEVTGYPTLDLVAAMALAGEPADRLTVCMAGGHGEWFVQDFGPAGEPLTPLASLTPDAARNRGAAHAIAGTRAAELAELLGTGFSARPMLPDARHASLLRAASFTDTIAPIYGRGPDARLPA